MKRGYGWGIVKGNVSQGVVSIDKRYMDNQCEAWNLLFTNRKNYRVVRLTYDWKPKKRK